MKKYLPTLIFILMLIGTFSVMGYAVSTLLDSTEVIENRDIQSYSTDQPVG